MVISSRWDNHSFFGDLMEHGIKIREINRDVILPGVVLLICFIFMRIVTAVLQMAHIDIPFRIMLVLAVSFGLVIPLSVIIAGLRDTSIPVAFLIPFVIFGIITPLIDSVFLGYSIMANPEIILFYLGGGLGFGIVGIGASRIATHRSYAILVIITGIFIILMNAPNYMRVIPFVITGDPAYIAGYLDPVD